MNAIPLVLGALAFLCWHIVFTLDLLLRKLP